MSQGRYKNRAAFFYLIMVNFVMAVQFVLFSVFWDSPSSFEKDWAIRGYLISFFLAFFVFGFISDVFKKESESEKTIQQGLIFFIAGNMACLFLSRPDIVMMGRILSGLASGMIFLGQVGILCSLPPKKFRIFSFWTVLSFALGFFVGPILVRFLSGPNLGPVDASLILGTATSAMAIFGASRVLDADEFSINSKKRKRKTPIIEAVREKFWLMFKFSILFAITAWFVSRNFGGLEIGLLVATAVTVLSISHSKIFDSASDAFLDVEEEDDPEDKAKKTITVILKRIFYTLLDYGLAALSVALVVAAINFGFSYLSAIMAMWLIIDLPSAAILVGIYEKTGRDMTLGRSYRRMANSIFRQSRAAGIVVFLYEVTLASFWSGPDYTIIFFKDELKTKIRTIIALLAITIIHSVLWTSVYWYGYEDVTELFRKAFGQN